MLMVSKAGNASAISIAGQQFRPDARGVFDIPDVLSAKARAEAGMIVAPASVLAPLPWEPDDDAKTTGDEFDHMDRAQLFAWLKAHALKLPGALGTDAVRDAIRASLGKAA